MHAVQADFVLRSIKIITKDLYLFGIDSKPVSHMDTLGYIII